MGDVGDSFGGFFGECSRYNVALIGDEFHGAALGDEYGLWIDRHHFTAAGFYPFDFGTASSACAHGVLLSL